jgi:RNA polymerase sigma-70 factor (ECF subfamily)
MRLAALLLVHPLGATPVTYALAALMCFNAARLPGRLDASGNLTSLFEQDRSLWDKELVSEGQAFLNRSASGSELSTYHLEAGIAAIHTSASRTEDTDWDSIISMYDTLLTINPSAVIALNRAIAVAQRDGSERGLEAIRNIKDSDRLAEYPFFFASLGELELRSGRVEIARVHFEKARRLARNPMEQRFLDQRVAACNSAGGAIEHSPARKRWV